MFVMRPKFCTNTIKNGFDLRPGNVLDFGQDKSLEEEPILPYAGSKQFSTRHGGEVLSQFGCRIDGHVIKHFLWLPEEAF